MARLDILFPVGRIVGGNLYKARTQDAEGKPLVFKTGAKQGQPRSDFYFAIAIPKNPGEQHWAQTEWGQKIYQYGAAAFPAMYQNPMFAWKIKDGDSTIPNRRNKRPCDQPGHPGHWIVSFGGGYAPRIYNRDGTQPMPEVDAVKPGYWVQVYGNVEDNGSPNQPGIYINHSLVAFQGYGPEIVIGPDAAAVGFGQAALPAGVSAAPVGGMAAPPVLAVPGAAVPLPGAAVPGVVVAPVAAAAPVPVAVQPQPQFLVPPAAAPVPAPVPVPVPTAVRQMTAKAGGASYEQFIQGGWNDQMLVAQGYMLP